MVKIGERGAHAFIITCFLHAALVARSSQRENSRPFNGIHCTLPRLSKAAPLSNLRGSKMQVVGWLVQIQCARYYGGPKTLAYYDSSEYTIL